MEKREPLTPDKFATVKQKGILEDHGEPIFALAFSPDAKLLVSGSRDNTVKVWDVKTDKLLHTLTTDGQTLHAMTLSPDGKIVAMGIVIRKDDKITGQEVRLFDVQTGKLNHTLKGTGTLPLTAVAFSPDGRTLATGSFGVDIGGKTVGDLRLWPLGKKDRKKPNKEAKRETQTQASDSRRGDQVADRPGQVQRQSAEDRSGRGQRRCTNGAARVPPSRQRRRGYSCRHCRLARLAIV
jgi:hypothetical protein